MTAALATPGETAGAGSVDRARLERAIDEACRRIAPLWPLRTFVAVNPFLGFTDRTFEATCAALHRIARLDMLMPRAFYRDALRRGRIDARDLEASIAAAPPGLHAPKSAAELIAALGRQAVPATHPGHVATVAEVLDSLSAGNRQRSGSGFMTGEISKFCAAYFDQGQSTWRLPLRERPLFPAWRAAMRYDRNPEVMGVAGFREIVAGLPDDPVEAIAVAVEAQGVPASALADYLYQTLADASGWAAYARYLGWQRELDGERDETLRHLLAVRVVWGYALFRQRTDERFHSAWRAAMEKAAEAPRDEHLGDDYELAADLLAQESYERAYARELIATIDANAARTTVDRERPELQAAFCIDVRSEVYRRALERVEPQARTLGFAGFFGYPIEYVRLGHLRGGAQCPVLLKPRFRIREIVKGESPAQNLRILNVRTLRRRVADAWKAFKISAVSSFVFVESAGLLSAAKLLTDTLALTRTVSDPDTDGLDRSVVERLGPSLAHERHDGVASGFTPEEKLDMAEAVLRAMSLTRDFAPLVLFVGHGSSTVNNPHAAGLDCGACGGHTGEANARVAAGICNDPAVRAGLRERGIAIPGDTWFAGCLHDTTTDDVTIFDAEDVPASHRARLDRARRRLEEAGAIARRLRAPRLGVPVDGRTDRRVRARARDWSQVRPEWGLAGNAAFIAAPRRFTRGLDLGGRVFLHEYDHALDRDGSVLELIVSAPMVVASWINLQYYGSTANNGAFGAGNKTLHNVCGGIGVLEGNAGDLKAGLPWQSLHDGTELTHEPVRLCVLIAAPRDAIDAAIEKHASARDLVENRWLHLLRIDESGRVADRYRGKKRWEPVDA
jgi:uncharacterized protein